jgi:phosphoglycolate phosphatase-like HAD superfamily hydrolase
MNDCYIFDLDGTLADLSHRIHHIQTTPKDWPAFFAGVKDDTPIEHVVNLYHIIACQADVIFVSGRSDACRDGTVWWLAKHGFTIHANGLYMRKEGDHRPDYRVKYDLLQQLKADGWNPLMAFDDRDQVVNMWRLNGIPCAQVAPGSF